MSKKLINFKINHSSTTLHYMFKGYGQFIDEKHKKQLI